MNYSSMEIVHIGGYHQARTWMLLEDQTVAEHMECTAEQAGDSGMYSGIMAVCFEGWSNGSCTHLVDAQLENSDSCECPDYNLVT